MTSTTPSPWSPPPPPPGAVPPRQPRSSQRTWLLAALGPAVLWISGCLIALAHLPDHVGDDCTADNFACVDGSKEGAMFMLVMGTIALVPIVTGLCLIGAAIGRSAGKVIVGTILCTWGVVSIQMAILGPRPG